MTDIRVFLNTILGVKTVFSLDLSAISLNFLVGHSVCGVDIRYMQLKESTHNMFTRFGNCLRLWSCAITQ